MSTINVDLKDLAKALRLDVSGRREAGLRALRLAVKSHGPRLAQAAVDASTPKPVDRGTYRRGFQAHDTSGGAVFLNVSPHAGIIEDGRRPGSRQPPVAAIEAWLRRKMRVAWKKRKMTPSAWRSAAFMVARAIARRGLPAHKILAKVEAQLGPIVRNEVTKALSTPSGGHK